MLKYFDGYVNCGFKPIAMFLKTKKPVSERWIENWSVDKWRNYFAGEEQKYNMGILLGDIVDVEADSEDSNEFLNKLVGNVPHPAYQSSRSTHHLFLNPDSNLTFCTFHGIEFRGNRVCSVLPPSIHETGIRYKFLKESTFTLSAMPKDLLNFYFQNKPKKVATKFRPNKPLLKPDHEKTICKVCKMQTFIHRKRLILEVKVFAKHNLPWMCHSCRKIDVREECRDMRKRLRNEEYVY